MPKQELPKLPKLPKVTEDHGKAKGRQVTKEEKAFTDGIANSLQAMQSGAEVLSFSDRVIFARRAKGLSGAEAARRCQMSAASWFVLEKKGKSTRNVFQVADMLGVSPRWLATGQGTMFDDPVDVTLPEMVESIAVHLMTFVPEARAKLVGAIVSCLETAEDADRALMNLELVADEVASEKRTVPALALELEATRAGGFSSVLPTPETATTIGESTPAKRGRKPKNKAEDTGLTPDCSSAA